MVDKENQQQIERTGLEIAVVGMAGRFPGANSLAKFWENIANGVDSIAQFTDEELLENGVDPSLLQRPNYRKAKGFIDDVEYFDADFFHYSEREAEIMDPQIRVLQECAWEALESAGYVPRTYEGRIGLFAGASINYKWMELSPLGRGAQGAEFTEAGILCYKDSLSTLTSYKLDLKGPSTTLYTACSTSLLAIHLACRALITGECDLALSGGVTISYPKKAGYLYEVGMTASSDGHTRPFDANATGAVFGDGAGIVLLKRLEEALQDGDSIYAVVKGSAANNDGARKVGYTAPSIEGQCEVITTALSLAEVEPETISYVETHGTATPLGDTIEFEALKRAFATEKKSYCAIGSVKSNVGHLDAAAGVAGFIKTVLALQHQQIPPGLHFDHPNPRIGFVDSPFYVNTELVAWDAAAPRRAGVSSFGYGGTNVHVVLEEAPSRVSAASMRASHMLTLAARTPSALATMARNLASFFKTHTQTSLADAAYTLHLGRQQFSYRRAVVCTNSEEALAGLEQITLEAPVAKQAASGKEQRVLLRLGAKGLSDPRTLRELYQQEPLIREEVDRCLQLIEVIFGSQVRRAMNASTAAAPAGNTNFSTFVRFCINFTLEYALSRTLFSLGVKPGAIAAQGFAQYTAACLAEVLSLEDALRWGLVGLQLASDSDNAVLRQRFTKLVCDTKLHKPTFPLFSEEAGVDITEDSAQDAEFWLRLADQRYHAKPGATQTVFEPSTSLLLQIGESEEAASEPALYGTHTFVGFFAQEIEPTLAGTHFLNVLAELWVQEIALDWARLYANERRLHLTLPTYPFEKKRFWIDPPDRHVHRQDQEIEKRTNIAEWLYTPTWCIKHPEVHTIAPSTWLFFQSSEQIGEQLHVQLQAQGHKVIIVQPATAFSKVSEYEYKIRATQADDYSRLWADIARSHPSPLRILHLWTLGKGQSGHQLLDLGFYSLLYLTKAIAQQASREELEITLLTDQVYKVAVDDQVLPEKAPLLAPLKVIPQEHSNIRCRCIDVHLAEASSENTILALLQEITLEITDTEIAYRSERRHVQTYESVPAHRLRTALSLATDAAVPPLREGGVYLITGGLGGIGFKLAGYLTRALQARLVLVGRTGLLPKDEWQQWIESHDPDDQTSFRIQQVQALEASGAQVLVVAADVADEEQMRRAFQQAEAVFGQVNGVIHAAGVVRVQSAQCSIATIRRDECEEQFRPKLLGVNVLHKLLEAYDIDFCLLVSSLSPILGGLGFVGYAAANLYMDAFVQSHSSDPIRRWISVNWGDWQYLGPKFQKRIARAAIDAFEMTTDEAIKTFQCVLSLDNARQVIVSSGDLLARIEQWIQLKPIRQESTPQQASVHSTQDSSQSREHLHASSQEQFEQIVAELWIEFYRVQEVDRDTNFFELGATSLDIIQIHTKLVELIQRHIPIECMFENPTITQLAAALSGEVAQRNRSDTNSKSVDTGLSNGDIAVIGMAGRFPGADSVEKFWQNLVHGVESIRFFTESELVAAGVRQEELGNPNYRKAKGYLEGTEYFDASFFDYTPRDALLMDPQLRIFHECAWSAIENAGYNINDYEGRVGVFAGASPNLYWQVLSMLAEVDEPAGLFLTSLLNDKDSLSTQISYKFNLNGPSVNVFSGCSTSLVAIDNACNALLAGQCDLALAGGITVALPDKAGYMYQEGMLFSADGHCRAFDQAASGMVFGDGVGIVVLKPLKQAIADGDTIRAVIKGTAINNDGHRKIGYTAPSVDGQAEVIKAAQAKAGVAPESIGYIETHGTATQLGDVIEVAALKKVFGSDTRPSCPIGSVKTNVGHLNAASGVAGFIKTVLCLENRLLPPSLHCETPNPQIDFASSPFYVNTTLQVWQNERDPLRAGVSSFGIGGTNAHVVLEEAPRIAQERTEREWKLLLLSAKSQAALERMTDNLADYFKAHPADSLADAAYTLQVGRQAFEYRRTLVCRNQLEVSDLLLARDSRVRTFQAPKGRNTTVFLFPGNGAQSINMARELYEKEVLFRAEMDSCFDLLSTFQGTDLKPLLYPCPGDQDAEARATLAIQSMAYSQPLIFCVEYALARLLMSWGIQPSAMIGYSFGEYAAACLAGVFSLRDALQLVVVRGRLMSELPAGAMVSVPLTEAQATGLLSDFKAMANGTAVSSVAELAIAIDNGTSCIVAGSLHAIADFERFMRTKRLLSMRVASDVAAHSSHLEHATVQFAEQLRHISLHAPDQPFISGLTGTWITNEEAQDPDYWVRHMKETVHFARGVEQLVKDTNALFLEVGPGRDLSVLLQRFLENQTQRVQQTIRPQGQHGSDSQFLFERLAVLWGQGISIDWQAFAAHEERHRIPLPTYAFEHTSYNRQGNPFELAQNTLARTKQTEDISKLSDLSQWFYVPRWRSTLLPTAASHAEQRTWLVFEDRSQVAASLAQELRNNQQQVITVIQGESFARLEEYIYQLDTGEQTHYHLLLDDLRKRELLPEKILHCASLAKPLQQERNLDALLKEGFYSLLFLFKALARQPVTHALDIRVVTSGTQNVTGDEQLIPAHACLLGPSIVSAQEFSYVQCSVIDVIVPEREGPLTKRLQKHLLAECLVDTAEHIVAYRGDYRWVCDYQPLELKRPAPEALPLKRAGTYLITGAFGGIGKILARYLAETYQAKIALVSRSPFPEREHWPSLGEQEAGRERVRFVQELESLGATILVLQADSADRDRMAQVVANVEQQFGAMNGVIHAAGLVGDETFKMLKDMEVSDCEKQFQAKVRGVLVLNELLHEKHLDFCLLMSSIASILGGLGYGAYAAANLFLDAFVHQQARQSFLPWYTVDWSDWKYWTDMEKGAIGQSVYKLSMEPAEGIDSFERVLSSIERQIIHSPGRLDLRIKQWVNLPTTSAEGDDLAQMQLHPRPALRNPYIAPRTLVEKTLADIWAATFRLEKVGIQDDFFELGGDSLKGITVVSKIHKELRVEFPVAGLFQTSTIAGLVEQVQKIQSTEFYAIPVTPIKEHYRLSSAQKRLYIIHQMYPHSTAYNDVQAYILDGELDAARCEKAFQQLIIRHESLRTSFDLRNNEPVQKVHPSIAFKLSYEETTEERARDFIKHFIVPFDLRQAPLIRIALIKVSADRHILVFDIHHIITDGVSFDCLMRDFITLYHGGTLPILKLQYKDYVEWQYSQHARSLVAQQSAYWLEKFAGDIPTLNLVTDYPRPDVQDFGGDFREFDLGQACTEQVKKAALAHNSTTYMYLLSVFNILLSKYTGAEDIIVGSPITGRSHPDLQNIIGMFVNMLPIRTAPVREKRFVDYLREVQKIAFEAFDHDDYQYDELIIELGLQGIIHKSPLFNVVFVMQNMSTDPPNIGNLHIEQYRFVPSEAIFDLVLSAVEINGNFRMAIEYATALFRHETIVKMISHYLAILQEVLSNPEIQIKDIHILHEEHIVEEDTPRIASEDFAF